MGLEQSVQFPNHDLPAWPAVSALLQRLGFPVQMRMIDNELAFPDEEPPGTWKELRLGTPAGMITVRRQARGLAFIVWGNAEPALLQARNALMWAFAELGHGSISTAEGTQSPEQFRPSTGLPNTLSGN
jgi:hypothetical protein